MLFVVLSLSTAVSGETLTKSITIITSFPVGAGPDGYTRVLAQVLEEKLKVPVVIENKPGGNGVVSLQAFNKDVRNTYSVYLTDPTVISAYPLIYNDTKPIENLKMFFPSTSTDLMLVSSADINNISELTKLIMQHPYYGSWAIGSTGHIYGAQLANFLKTPATHVPYKDYTNWLVDVSNKSLAFSFVTMASGRALEQTGKIKFLAIAAKQRNPAYPNVPTLDEFLGKKSRIDGPTTGAAFYINKSITPEIESSLKEAFELAFSSQEFRNSIRLKNYSRWIASDSDIIEDTDKYRRLIKQLNINLSK